MVLAVIVASAAACHAQPGALDPSFDAGSATDGSIHVMAVQTDGRIFVGGDFQAVHDGVRNRIARLNADGSLDSTFGDGLEGANGTVRSIAIQDDGRVLIAGDFTAVNGVDGNRIARLNADGSLDNSFGGGFAGTDGRIWSVAVQQDGKILIGGVFRTVNGVMQNNLARLNPDGSFDTSFNVELARDDSGLVLAMAVLNDGKVLIGGGFETVNGVTRNRLARLNSDGSVDPDFNPDIVTISVTQVRSLSVESDGKIVIGGELSRIGSEVRDNIARLNQDGSLDTSFAAATFDRESGFEHGVTSVASQTNGQVLVVGAFTRVNDVRRGRIARLDADGSLDEEFAGGLAGADGTVHFVTVQADGRILIGGEFINVNGVARSAAARLNTDGSLDTRFAENTTRVRGVVNCFEVQPDGRIVVGGNFDFIAGALRSGIARLNPDGSLDGSFGDGLSGVFGAVNCLAIQPDGKVVIGGSFGMVNGTERNRIARLNPDGSLDPTFGEGLDGVSSAVNDLVLQSDGKVVLGGQFTRVNDIVRNRIARLHSDGTLDESFGEGTGVAGSLNPRVLAVALQNDGKIVIGGEFWTVHGAISSHIARLHQNGTHDNSFVSDAAGWVESLAVQTDEKVLIGGWFSTVHGVQRNRIARLNANGSLDNTFGTGLSGVEGGYDPRVNAIAIQPDGKVIIGGNFTLVNGETRNRIARVLRDGSLDASFGAGMSGAIDDVFAVALHTDERVLIGGRFSIVNGVARGRVARLYGDTFPPPTETVVRLTANSIPSGQTGLFQEILRIGNPTPAAFAALRVVVQLDTNSVARGVRVWNAAGHIDGAPFLLYNQPLDPGQSVDLVVEYYIPDRRTLPTATYQTEVVPAEAMPDLDGTALMVGRVLRLENNDILVEFSTEVNRAYYVQYSDDMANWKTALPATIGTGSRVQWIDNGPPKTDSRPNSQPNRYYRIMLSP